MIARAKFQCHSVKKCLNADGTVQQIEVRFGAVCDNAGSNKSWSKWTPFGNLEMAITNPDLFDAFRPGQEYFLDVTAAAAPAKA